MSGTDFSQLFMSLGSYLPLPYPTNYKISNGKDLNAIFASANQQAPFVINSSSASASYIYINGYYLITIINTNSTSISDIIQYGNITFNSNINNCYVICVAGGGGGGGAGNNAEPNISNYSGRSDANRIIYIYFQYP